MKSSLQTFKKRYFKYNLLKRQRDYFNSIIRKLNKEDQEILVKYCIEQDNINMYCKTSPSASKIEHSIFYVVPCYSGEGTHFIVTVDTTKKYIHIYQPLNDVQTKPLHIPDTKMHTIYTYEKCKLFHDSKHKFVTTVEPLFSSTYDIIFVGMHNHKKEHIGNTILFCIHKKYFWVADGYVSSLNIKDTVVAYVSPLHPSPYPIIFTKHHLYVYCGTFEIYPQTSSSKRIQNLVAKMQNNTPLTTHEQTKLESFYKEYECAHRSEKNLKQVVICSSVIGTQLYVAPDAEPLSFTEWMTKTYEPFVLRNIKNNLHPSKPQPSKTFWSIQKYMGYHTQKLKQNEDMYNICSGKIGTNGKCKLQKKTLKQIKLLIESQQKKAYKNHLQLLQ